MTKLALELLYLTARLRSRGAAALGGTLRSGAEIKCNGGRGTRLPLLSGK